MNETIYSHRSARFNEIPIRMMVRLAQTGSVRLGADPAGRHMQTFAGVGPGAAKGLTLRHDHGSNYMSENFRNEIKCFGIVSSPSFVRQPEGNGVAEWAIRALKEQLLWVATLKPSRHSVNRATVRKTRLEIIRLSVMMYVRFPLGHWNIEDLLHERGIDISHEAVGFWLNRFGPLFEGEKGLRFALHECELYRNLSPSTPQSTTISIRSATF